MKNSAFSFSVLSDARRITGEPDLWRPQVWLYVPAYLSLLVALGAMCRALAHFISSSEVAMYLWLSLIFNGLISFGVQCGGARLSQWSRRVRGLTFLILPLAAMVFGASMLASLDGESAINATVMLIVGWTSVLCVLLVGARHGTQRLPLASPLIPALSLFGLLNSLSVDTLIQICFLVFVAASLYLIVYEPMLHRLDARRDDTSDENRKIRRAASSPARRWPALLSRAAIGRAAASYLAACSVWFAAFLGGAALFYYPVEAFLPRLMARPVGAMRGASAALLDWRGSSPIMELRGGNYPLSDRPVMQVEMWQNAQSMNTTSALWRGRIYEQYDASRWIEIEEAAQSTLRLKRGVMSPIPLLFADRRTGNAILDQAKNPRAHYSPQLVRRYQVEALIQPERFAPRALYFPGELTATQAPWRQLQARANGTYTSSSYSRNRLPYAIRSEAKEERLSGLMRASGLSTSALQDWKSDPDLALTLDTPSEVRAQLAPIVGQIRRDIRLQGHGQSTPYAKVNAVATYLANTCTYSLSSPLVPATDDAVMFFLTKSKRGACDMFASSMVLLLRSLDVPARLATGYLAPEEITEDRITMAGSTPTGNAAGRSSLMRSKKRGARLSFTLREKDAHAWVEYFVPGAGWLSYDPTAGTRTTELPIGDQLASMLNLPSWQMPRHALWLPLCGLLLIGTSAAWSLLDWRARQKQAPPTPDDLMRARTAEAYEQALRVLRRRVPFAAHLTPHEYEAAVNRAAIPHAAKQEFAGLTYLLIAARYSDQPPEMSREELQACVARLRHALRH